jgi:hypothetical protein
LHLRNDLRDRLFRCVFFGFDPSEARSLVKRNRNVASRIVRASAPQGYEVSQRD